MTNDQTFAPFLESHLRTVVPLNKESALAGWEAAELVLSWAALLVGGSTFVPGALARVARLLPEARIATLRGAGHLLPMERPSETAAAILDFLTN